MKRISADYVFPISSPPIKNGIITLADDGTILEVGPATTNYKLQTTNYDGAICPGFVNTHCHLELSYLKGKLSEKTGMAGFIREIISKRGNYMPQEVERAIAAAEKEMIEEGIVAVGDISNHDFSFEQKAKSNLFYHTFLEVFDFNPANAETVFAKGKALQLQTTNSKPRTPHSSLLTSITPHAPYTLSVPLAQLISKASAGKIISIHNQESLAEDEFFRSKTGPMKQLYDQAGIDTSHFSATGRSPLHYTLGHLTGYDKLLLVHNTYTTRNDISYAHSQLLTPHSQPPTPHSQLRTLHSQLRTPYSQLRTPHSQLFWCTCPNANLYIENKLPDYPAFIAENARMTIGTDSYASNRSLSIVSELKTIAANYPAIGLGTLLRWATLNGAEFLGIEKEVGSIERGKKPGLVHISDVDFSGMKLTSNSRAKRIVL